jgi:hypothetical protein
MYFYSYGCHRMAWWVIPYDFNVIHVNTYMFLLDLYMYGLLYNGGI